MRDFTFRIYKDLLNGLIESGYMFYPFQDYLQEKNRINKLVILRHDVDKAPKRSLKLAEKEREMGIRGTFFFRVKKNKFDSRRIKQIVSLGHEAGFHYENLDLASGNMETALNSFQEQLAMLRKVTPINTACMHGSPMSKHDNRDMWKDRSYREFGIIGEPYFDVDFSKVMYLTDTGRRWDGDRVSIRDKVRGDRLGVIGEEKDNNENKWPRLHSTQDLINALRNNELPDQIMLTIHPQRWTDAWGPWVWELVSQKVKNVVKYFMVKSRE